MIYLHTFQHTHIHQYTLTHTHTHIYSHTHTHTNILEQTHLCACMHITLLVQQCYFRWHYSAHLLYNYIIHLASSMTAFWVYICWSKQSLLQLQQKSTRVAEVHGWNMTNRCVYWGCLNHGLQIQVVLGCAFCPKQLLLEKVNSTVFHHTAFLWRKFRVDCSKIWKLPAHLIYFNMLLLY